MPRYRVILDGRTVVTAEPVVEAANQEEAARLALQGWRDYPWHHYEDVAACLSDRDISVAEVALLEEGDEGEPPP